MPAKPPFTIIVDSNTCIRAERSRRDFDPSTDSQFAPSALYRNKMEKAVKRGSKASPQKHSTKRRPNSRSVQATFPPTTEPPTNQDKIIGSDGSAIQLEPRVDPSRRGEGSLSSGGRTRGVDTPEEIMVVDEDLSDHDDEDDVTSRDTGQHQELEVRVHNPNSPSYEPRSPRYHRPQAKECIPLSTSVINDIEKRYGPSNSVRFLKKRIMDRESATNILKATRQRIEDLSVIRRELRGFEEGPTTSKVNSETAEEILNDLSREMEVEREIADLIENGALNLTSFGDASHP